MPERLVIPGKCHSYITILALGVQEYIPTKQKVEVYKIMRERAHFHTPQGYRTDKISVGIAQKHSPRSTEWIVTVVHDSKENKSRPDFLCRIKTKRNKTAEELISNLMSFGDNISPANVMSLEEK